MVIDAAALAAARKQRRPSDPAGLAQRLIPGYHVTPAIALISDVLADVITKPDQRVICTTPPRTGKSVLASVITPVLALSLDPDCNVIVKSYADELAEEHSREARRLIVENRDLLGIELAQDKSAVGRWRVKDHRGGMLAGGIMSGTTGFGADCVSGDTYILTEYGYVTAERAYREHHSWIWAFDHTTGMAGFHKVDANRRIECRELVTVRTQNRRVLRCTPDHRVYTRRGYIQARDLTTSDAVLTFDRARRMPPLRGAVPDHGDGVTQSIPPRSNRPVLLWSMPVSAGRRQEAHPVLCGVRGADNTITSRDVQCGMLQKALVDEATQAGTERVSGLWGGVRTDIVSDYVLRQSVREAGAFRCDDRCRESSIYAWHELREVVQVDATDDHGTRRGHVRGMWSVASSADVHAWWQRNAAITVEGPSHQRTSCRQPAREPDHYVPSMPYAPSQVGYDPVSSVSRDRGATHSVYDFQVAGAHNFFADGLLVHNCLIVDDPIKNAAEADSAAFRRRLVNEFRASLLSRIHPGGSAVLILTRWHPEDLAGTLLAEEPERWRVVNIPAVAEEGTPDVLGRAPGVAMVSALGRTAEGFAQLRRDVGERTWHSMYQGAPVPPEGGLFSRSWFEPHAETPEHPVATIVGVDPADTGEGDEAGIVAGALDGDGTIVLTEDWSGKFTSDQWAKRAVQLALEIGAREVAFEAYTVADTYVTVLKRAYRDLREESPSLPELPPFVVHKWRAGGKVDSIGRSHSLRQALEIRRCRTVAYKLAVFEDDACGWQLGQHQPDRVSAAIIAHDRLAALAGAQAGMAAPLQAPPSQAPAWLKRSLHDVQLPGTDTLRRVRPW